MEIYFIKHLEGENTSLDIKLKNLKSLFLPENKHLKPSIYCKNNGKWKLQTRLSWNYDFAFANLLKNTADFLPGPAIGHYNRPANQKTQMFNLFYFNSQPTFFHCMFCTKKTFKIRSNLNMAILT